MTRSRIYSVPLRSTRFRIAGVNHHGGAQRRRVARAWAKAEWCRAQARATNSHAVGACGGVKAWRVVARTRRTRVLGVELRWRYFGGIVEMLSVTHRFRLRPSATPANL